MKPVKGRLLTSWLAFNLLISLILLPASAAVSAPKSKPGKVDKKDKIVSIPNKKINKTPIKPEFAPGEVIVKYKSRAPEKNRKTTRNKLGIKTKKKLHLRNADLVRVKKGDKVEDVVAKLKKDPNVEYAEPNYVCSILDFIPNDPQFPVLWGMQNTGQYIGGSRTNKNGVAGMDIKAPAAWDITQGSSDIVVGVIDTGMDINHPDLQNNIWTNPGESGSGRETNGVDDDGNGYIDDVHGWDCINNDGTVWDTGDHYHATHCAGTIAGIGNNGIGVIGVAPNVKVASLKFLGPYGSGYISDALEAVIYATTMGFPITSNSWGGGGYSQAFKDAVDNYQGIFVASAGNSSDNNDLTPHYPSSYNCSNILAVAAINNEGNRASFSCYGATSVDVGAPGVDVMSCLPNNSYGYLSGTSMAAPHTSGAVALALSLDPTPPPTQIIDYIKNTVTPLASLQGRCVSGGMVNAYNLVAEIAPIPRVLSTDPVNNAIEVPGDATITVTFDEDIFADVGFDDISMNDGSVSVETNINISGDILSIKPLVSLPINKTYTVSIPANAVKSSEGDQMFKPYSFKFKTHDTVPPTVISTDPSNGDVGVVLDKTIEITFDEPITDGANFNSIALENINGALATNLSTDGSTLHVNPDNDLSYDTTYTVTIPAGAVNDLAGIALDEASSFSFVSFHDSFPPAVVETDPGDGTIGVPVDKTITITFEEPIFEGATFSQIALSDDTHTISSTISTSDAVLTIKPNSNLDFETHYTVELPYGAIFDSNGNYSSEFSFSFDTPDPFPPVFVSSIPTDGSTGTAINNNTYTINFSEPIIPGSAWDNIKFEESIQGLGIQLVTDISKIINGSTLKLVVPTPLDYDTDYSITIPAGSVQDVTGNPLLLEKVISFRTEFDTDPLVVSSSDPSQNATQVPVNKMPTVTFSKKVYPGSSFDSINLKDATGAVVDSTITVSGKVLTVQPKDGLEADSSYTLSVPADAVKDAIDNTLTEVFTLHFNTVDTFCRVVSSTPVDGATDVPVSTSNIKFDFEESIYRLNLYMYANPTLTANGVTVPITVSTSFNPMLTYITITPTGGFAYDTTYTVNLPTGTAKDAFGNWSQAYTMSFKTEKDLVCPTVSSSDPASGATQIPADKIIKVTFSENVFESDSFDSINLKDATGAVVDSTITVSGKVLTVQPKDGLEADSSYTLSVPADAVKDAADNVFVDGYTLSFNTVDDICRVVSSTPVDGATDVPVSTSNIRFEFGEPIYRLNIPFFYPTPTLTANGVTVPITVSTSFNPMLTYITITPTGGFAYDTTYTVNLPTGTAKDAFGNWSQAYTMSFTTETQ